MSGEVPFQNIIAREAELAVRRNVYRVLEAIGKGDFSDFLLPPQQTPTEVRQDAKDRAKRTLIQQFGIDLLIAVATVILPYVLDLDVTSKEQWTFIGLLIVKTVISSTVSYAFRLFVAPKEAGQVSLAQAQKGA